MHRSSDPEFFKVDRVIPLPWLVGAMVAAMIQAILIWHGQEKQADAIARMTDTISDQTKHIQSLSIEIGMKNLKDVEHDLKFIDVERRLGIVEGRK